MMITKVSEEVFTACENGEFLKASEKFLSGCKNEKDCLCRSKNLKDVSMCMISHMQYFTMMEDEQLSKNILENYVRWRASSQANQSREYQSNITPAKKQQNSNPKETPDSSLIADQIVYI